MQSSRPFTRLMLDIVPAGRTSRLLIHRSPWTVSHRCLSSRNQQPRFQIPAHVAAFSILLLPALAYFAYAEQFGPDKEELEATIRERYGKNTDQQQQNKAMSDFFQKAIMNPNGDVDRALNEVLRAGRSSTAQETTRRAALTSTTATTGSDTPATASGSAKDDSKVQRQQDGAGPLQAASNPQPKRKRKKKVVADLKEAEALSVLTKPTTTAAPLSETTKSVLLLSGVAVLAATVGFLAGGKRQ